MITFALSEFAAGSASCIPIISIASRMTLMDWTEARDGNRRLVLGDNVCAASPESSPLLRQKRVLRPARYPSAGLGPKRTTDGREAGVFARTGIAENDLNV